MIIEKTELFALGKHTSNAQDGVIIGLLFDQLTLDQIYALKE
ncbi:hypothetical protein SFC23_00530 [Shouchella clausii]|nr:hypothetical protein [Shouchella clausii]